MPEKKNLHLNKRERGRLKKIIVFFLVMGTVAMNRSVATAAYNLDFWYIQHRVTEEGDESDRMIFSIRDGSGNSVTQNVVASLSLTDPEGQEVPLSGIEFGGADELSGWYDAMKGKWVFEEDFSYRSYFSSTIDQPLITGFYHLEIVFTDGTSLFGDSQFNGLADLPIVPALSFRTYKNSANDLIFKWAIPYTGNAEYDTSIRAVINIYNGVDSVGDIYLTMPTHMDLFFLPDHIVQKMSSMGNRFLFTVSLRTKDNNNRTYSKYHELNLNDFYPPYSIHLTKGWNLVDYPSPMPRSPDEAMASITGKYDMVWRFSQGSWNMYHPNNIPMSDINTMQQGYGYWIHTTQECVWTVP